jgi:hypothetical protein
MDSWEPLGFGAANTYVSVPSIVQGGQVITSLEYRPTVTVADGGGKRFDDGKPRYDLVPPEAMDALADHYRKGAKKYEDRNWERGMAWGKCFASMMRHAWAWMRGEEYDVETGTHHMIAVAWNAIALFVYHERKIGNDDRNIMKENGK